MSLNKVTTKITYKVPAWCHCNLQGNIFGQPSKDKCRFCINERGYHRCALYNEVLGTEQGTLINKCPRCKKASAGFDIPVEEEEVESAPIVDPKKLMKYTLAEYNKARRQLISQGYPEVIADKLAQEYVLGG